LGVAGGAGATIVKKQIRHDLCANEGARLGCVAVCELVCVPAGGEAAIP
jgi:hypothetical protein